MPKTHAKAGNENSPLAVNDLNDWNWLPMPDHDIDGYQIPEGASEDKAGLE